jgi:hypothetical protein
MSQPEQPADRPGEARPAAHPPATPQPDPTAPPPVSQHPVAHEAGSAGTGPDQSWAGTHDTPTGYDPAAAQAYADTYGQTYAQTYAQPHAPGYGTPGYGMYGPGGQASGVPGHPHPGYGWAGYGGQQPTAPWASPYGYGQLSYPAHSFAYGPAPRTNGLAVASMSVSISALVLMLCTNGLSGFLGLVGAVLGHVSRRQVRERGEAGGGMALAGVIVGWVATGFALIALTALVFLVVNTLNEPAGPYTT